MILGKCDRFCDVGEVRSRVLGFVGRCDRILVVLKNDIACVMLGKCDV
ncbi:hypothetical protein [Nostoc sp. FACHB-110]|nr:hypothetical protein [Nostoc sp. FACHB-110]MBD2435427.1 hypothetical protein [Nostoc sp. FACHB-110]